MHNHNINCHAAVPTGKAACKVNGYTIFPAECFKVPVLKGNQVYTLCVNDTKFTAITAG